APAATPRERAWCSPAGPSATRAATAPAAPPRPSTDGRSACPKRSSTGRYDRSQSLTADYLGERLQLFREARHGVEQQVRRARRRERFELCVDLPGVPNTPHVSVPAG